MLKTELNLNFERNLVTVRKFLSEAGPAVLRL